MKEFVIQRNDSNQRVDKFLGKAVKGLPKSLMYKYIRLKRIKVNGKRCEISTILQEGDLLSLYINDEFFSSLKDPVTSFLQAPTALQIVYEDENILLIDKPPGLVVHEDNRQLADSLINRIKHICIKKGNIVLTVSFLLRLRFAIGLTETPEVLWLLLKTQKACGSSMKRYSKEKFKSIIFV